MPFTVPELFPSLSHVLSGTAYPSSTWLHLQFLVRFVLLDLLFSLYCFVDHYFFFWPLYFLSFYDVQLLITPLVSSNFSCYSWKRGYPCPMELCPCLLELEARVSVSYGVMPLFTWAGNRGIRVLWKPSSIFYFEMSANYLL